MNRHRFLSAQTRLLLAMVLVMSCSAYGDVVVFGQVGFTDEQFEQWVFQQYGNSTTARTKLNESLELYTEDVHRSCDLSDSQLRKLRLAGRGDVERFFRRFAEAKEKFQKIRNDQQKVNQIWQDISPLQMQLSSGLFDRDSLLQKSLVNTINRQQFLQYTKLDDERRRFHHESKIKLVITMLDQAAPITAEQRRRLTELLREETSPSRKGGQYEYYAMMYQVAQISEPKLKPILDDVQWQVFNQQLAQMRGMEQWLKQNGMLPNGDEDEDVLLPDEQVAAE
ncbi:MAG: hypothetical protein O3B13_00990 [Planctomycetota bacterium]|nr:hypothetical protein [Planctomycetota bacterium]MDA1161654.1 hypothetical protein [Planctomycetota bacterium]